MDRTPRLPDPPILKEGSTNIEVLKPLLAEFNKVVRYLRAMRDIQPQLSRDYNLQLMQLTHAIGLQCDPESSDSSVGLAEDAVLMMYDQDNLEFSELPNSISKSGVREFFDLPYDEGDRLITFYHRPSSQHIPVNLRTVRHCRTCADENGEYPSESDAASGHPVVYPFQFTRIEFMEEPGSSRPDITMLCPDSDQDGYFLNLYCNEFDSYLPVGTDVWIYNVTDQWFSYVAAAECESESSSSLSESSASSGEETESSSESSQGSSESSSSEQSSSESSVSISSESVSSELSSESSSVSISQSELCITEIGGIATSDIPVVNSGVDYVLGLAGGCLVLVPVVECEDAAADLSSQSVSAGP